MYLLLFNYSAAPSSGLAACSSSGFPMGTILKGMFIS